MNSKIFAGLVVLLSASFSRGGTVDAPYEVGTWRGFRPAAISFTFDDDCSNQYAVAVPMFAAKGLKMTLFTVTSWVPAWAQVQTAASCGNEIASHTVTHPILSGLTPAQQTNELKNSKDIINANISGQRCVTLAYPNCVEANEPITLQYYIAARGCSGSLVPSTPANFLNISSYVCGSLGQVKTLQNFTNLANSAAGGHQWCVYLIHGIDADGGYSPLPSTTLQSVVDYFSTNQVRYWVETFGNVVRYIRERNAVSVTQTATNDDRLTLQVTDGLDNATFDYPITLRRPLPAGWPTASVSQNGKPVAAQLVDVGLTHSVMFDVVPDDGEVILNKSALPPVLSHPVQNGLSQFAFRLEGDPGFSYATCSSTDLLVWSFLQTNTLTDTHTDLTFTAEGPVQFYRAQWVPQ